MLIPLPSQTVPILTVNRHVPALYVGRQGDDTENNGEDGEKTGSASFQLPPNCPATTIPQLSCFVKWDIGSNRASSTPVFFVVADAAAESMEVDLPAESHAESLEAPNDAPTTTASAQSSESSEAGAYAL